MFCPPNVTGGGGGDRVGVRLGDAISVRLAFKGVFMRSVRYDL